jgi:hypothetical protein
MPMRLITNKEVYQEHGSPLVRLLMFLMVCLLCTGSPSSHSETLNVLIPDYDYLGSGITKSGQRSQNILVQNFLQAILEDTEHTIEIHQLPLMRIYQAIDSNAYENWIMLALKMGDSTGFEGIAPHYHLTPVIYPYDCVIISKESKKADKTPATKIVNQSVAMVTHPFFEEHRKKLFAEQNFNFIAVKSMAIALKLLVNNRVDYVAAGPLALSLSLKRLNLDSSDFNRQLCPGFNNINVHFIMDNKASPELIEFIDERIISLQQQDHFANQVINYFKKVRGPSISSDEYIGKDISDQ